MESINEAMAVVNHKKLISSNLETNFKFKKIAVLRQNKLIAMQAVEKVMVAVNLKKLATSNRGTEIQLLVQMKPKAMHKKRAKKNHRSEEDHKEATAEQTQNLTRKSGE